MTPATPRELTPEEAISASVLMKEPEIQRLHAAMMEREARERAVVGCEAEKKERAFVTRLEKSGYECEWTCLETVRPFPRGQSTLNISYTRFPRATDNIERLVKMNSLMGCCPFVNRALLILAQRRELRKKNPGVVLGRASGVFEANFYFVEKKYREQEKEEQMAVSGLIKHFR